MKLEFFIARRYLFSRKSSNAVNVISWISVFSIAVATFALVTVLSAFNGLQALVESLYENFDPDVKISAAEGKWLDLDEQQFQDIQNTAGVEHVIRVLEELTLAKYGESQSPCTMKGVEDVFVKTSGIEGSIVEGSSDLSFQNQPAALVGYSLSGNLGLYIDDLQTALKLYVPRLSTTTIIDPSQAFRVKTIWPSGIFMINPDIDQKYIVVPISFAQSFLSAENKFTALELKVAPDKELEVKEKLRKKLGEGYKIETRFEMNEIIYQTNKAEKVVTVVILIFVLLIAAFNVISTLTMILLEKKGDIETLKVLGFDISSLRKIFLSEGLMINGIGAVTGLVLGIAVCWLQTTVGLVRLEGGIVEFYPVKMLFSDFVLIAGVVMIIGIMSSYFPSRFLLSGNKV